MTTKTEELLPIPLNCKECGKIVYLASYKQVLAHIAAHEFKTTVKEDNGR